MRLLFHLIPFHLSFSFVFINGIVFMFTVVTDGARNGETRFNHHWFSMKFRIIIIILFWLLNQQWKWNIKQFSVYSIQYSCPLVMCFFCFLRLFRNNIRINILCTTLCVSFQYLMNIEATSMLDSVGFINLLVASDSIFNLYHTNTRFHIFFTNNKWQQKLEWMKNWPPFIVSSRKMSILLVCTNVANQLFFVFFFVSFHLSKIMDIRSKLKKQWI